MYVALFTDYLLLEAFFHGSPSALVLLSFSTLMRISLSTTPTNITTTTLRGPTDLCCDQLICAACTGRRRPGDPARGNA